MIPRPLTEVIDQMMELIPRDQLNLRVELAKQKESSLFQPPETQSDVWGRVAAALEFYLGRDPKQFTGWKREVFEIFTGSQP